MAKKKGAENLAMAREGTQYSDPMGRYSLSWPYGGEREVIQIPHDERDGRLERRVTEGFIEETEDAANKEMGGALANAVVLTGEAAKEHMKIPVPESGIGFKAFSIHEEATIDDVAEATEGTPQTEEEDPNADLDSRAHRADLDAIAAAEDVDISEASNKAEVIGAITAARAAKAAEAEPDEGDDDDDDADAEMTLTGDALEARLEELGIDGEGMKADEKREAIAQAEAG